MICPDLPRAFRAVFTGGVFLCPLSFGKVGGVPPANAMLNQKKAPPIPAEFLPRHLAIVMDGNGRWAQKRGLPRYAGHSVGAKAFKEIARYCNNIGIGYLTVYAFSTENWKRPQKEVDTIMDLFREYLKDSCNYVEENIRTRFIGDRTPLAPDLIELMAETEKLSENATGMTLNIAINYGGRDEITRAVRVLAEEYSQGKRTEPPTEADISALLDTAGQPDPDLIIRPSGEQRTSNYLLWQSAYSEYIFMDILWPDFSPKHLDKALKEFASRNRRFGGV